MGQQAEKIQENFCRWKKRKNEWTISKNGHQFCYQKIQLMEETNRSQDFGRWAENQQELIGVIEKQFYKEKVAEF